MWKRVGRWLAPFVLPPRKTLERYKLHTKVPLTTGFGFVDADSMVMFTYGHELANLLDYRMNPKGKNGKPPGFVYGTPGIDPTTNRRRDADTGQAMEDCMKKRLGNQ